MRVLHAPVSVGNQPWVLSRGERALGVHSDLIVNYQTWLQYPADKVLSAHAVRSRRAQATRLVYGLGAPFWYHVLHYYFGRSLTCWDDYGPRNRKWFLDLRLGRALGRKIFMTLQGCDVRLAEVSHHNNLLTPCAEGRCQYFNGCVAKVDNERRWLIENILPLCDRVLYLNPELGRFVPSGTFFPYASVDIDALQPIFPGNLAQRKPRIVHAPSDDAIKGTALILAALDEVAKTHEFELILVRGKPHAEALAIYREADLAIDQLWAGWYGGFAVEMMALGKPVLCYIRESDLVYVPEAMARELPIVRTEPKTIAADVRALLDARSEWAELSKRSRVYVERWHHPRKLAAVLIQAYGRADARVDLSVLCAD